jgi:hypothetical protein
VTQPFIGSDPHYTDAINTVLKIGFFGDGLLDPLPRRKLGNNEQVPDSDKWLEGRTEPVEQSIFLWYPWVIAMATSVSYYPGLERFQATRLRELAAVLLERVNDAGSFVRSHENMYPTAETLFADGYYLRRAAITARQ